MVGAVYLSVHYWYLGVYDNNDYCSMPFRSCYGAIPLYLLGSEKRSSNPLLTDGKANHENAWVSLILS